MIRLPGSSENMEKEYDLIFKKRDLSDPNWQDIRRWKKLLKHYRGGNLIDIGCLDSNIPLVAKMIFPEAEVFGIDIAEEAIKTLSDRYKDYVSYKVMDLYNLQFPDDRFDYAVMGEVLEHLDNPPAAIEEAMRVLKPKGWLAISVPLNEAKEMGAVDLDHHVWSYSIEDMYGLLRNYGSVKTFVLGSQHFPTYKYAFPSLLAYCKKK